MEPRPSPHEADRAQLDAMIRQLRRAARVPFPARSRLERLLDALFGYALDHPDTYRLLVADATPLATAARTEVTAEVAGLLAGSRSGTATVDQVTAASVGVVGFALAAIGLCLSGTLDRDQAWRVTCEFCASQLKK